MDGADGKRSAVSALDQILGARLPVLSDGFVRVVDYMGSDAAIVQAARVSYGAGTKKVREDRALIRYLMRHRHTTPFEMCVLKLHVRVPMDCWRQWIRHRTASVNEYSTRYSVAIDAAHTTSPSEWRKQASQNRQGSEGFLPSDVGEELSKGERELQAAARRAYELRLSSGVAREQARKDLPLSTYTEAYWKIDLHNLLHFLELRMDSAAQAEIRAYAQVIGGGIVAKWCPDAWQAFLEYRSGGVVLSQVEVELVKMLREGRQVDAVQLAEAHGLVKVVDGRLEYGREGREMSEKLARLGFPGLG